MAVTSFAMLARGRHTLQAHRTAMNVVSHNMANSGVDGYSRQEAHYVAQNAHRSREGYIGNGVDIDRLVRHNSPMIERRLDLDTSTNNESRERLEILAQMEVVYTDESYSIGPGITDFFNSWRNLSQNPASTISRRETIARGQDLAARINSAAQRIQALRSDQDANLAGYAEEVSSLASTVARLNREIQDAESTFQAANDLRDERQRAIRGLSELIDINTYSDQAGNVLVGLGDGTSLVSGRRSGRLSASPDPNNSNLMGVFFVDADGTSRRGAITADITGGRIGGLIASRDGFAADALGRLDRMAFDFVTEVNRVHNGGFTLPVDPGPPPGTLVPRTGQDFFVSLGGVSGAARAMSVNGDVVRDPRLIAAATDVNAVPGDNRNALLLADISNNSVIAGDPPTDYWSNEVRRAGNAVAQANRDRDVTGARLNQTQNLREAVSGVNIDQELSDLVKIQAAYEAAAKIVTTADEMLQTVLAIKR